MTPTNVVKGGKMFVLGWEKGKQKSGKWFDWNMMTYLSNLYFSNSVHGELEKKIKTTSQYMNICSETLLYKF